MLNIENMQEALELNDELIKALEMALDEVTSGEGVEYDSEVGLYLVDDEKMAEINKEQREVEGTTDVLSFPLIAYEDKKTFKEEFTEDKLRDEMFLNDSLLLGDIVISTERARAQSAEYGHSLLREMVFLFVHSLLHLLGYDHMEEGDRKKMREKEDYYMDLLGITR